MMDQLLRPTLIAGHAALAMLGLAAMTIARPAPQSPQWHTASQSSLGPLDLPRRLPASRRAERLNAD